MSDSSTQDSAAESPPRSAYTATSSVDARVEEFEAEIDELMQHVKHKAELLIGWQETYDFEVQHQVRALWVTVGEIQRENQVILARLDELYASVAGDTDAQHRVCRREDLRKSRDTLVKTLTGNPSWTWETYVNSMPEYSPPSAAAEGLYQAAKDAIPMYEAKAQVPPPIRAESAWKVIEKGRAREDKDERKKMEEEYEKRLREAREAQRLLGLLRDEEVWGFVMK